MKTVTDGFQVKRVSNKQAEKLVGTSGTKPETLWRYTPKSVWKHEVRNKEK